MALRVGKDTGSFLPGSPGERMRPAVVARAFQALPSAHREILTETVFRDRSVNEAAASLGVPVDVVKVRVYQALRALSAAVEAPRPIV
ncbi:sigma factor-like helix-turn-helix DNA-binding protein [Spirillospora sp. CA-142024]|uniref:sigma factor-like helix-turn-helix DNA-binding protein n=1 Tax=Spirillospora sp. CA-142024 TaxID=3240036 RepID=UPI003D8D1FDD